MPGKFGHNRPERNRAPIFKGFVVNYYTSHFRWGKSRDPLRPKPVDELDYSPPDENKPTQKKE